MNLDFIRRKPRTAALIATGLAAVAGYAVFIAKDPILLLSWAPLALCVLMHGAMHGGHGHTPSDPAPPPRSQE